ncbi:ABC1-domain-containing protein [Schizopora paradoxa]|uniref:ABC1-domain-containing protein n=1 Tax=Schizopora paradoxa TaxID=27342 RepID=A0A0H2R6U3_9AGAM|nr:ABC1-domain-containing protein [Schizopora paradoxa]
MTTTAVVKLANSFKNTSTYRRSCLLHFRGHAAVCLPNNAFFLRGYSLKSSPQPSQTSSKFAQSSGQLRRWTRRFACFGLALGGVYVADKQFFSSSLTRTARTFATGVIIASDYKINFRAHPPFAESIADVHARNAERIYDLLRANGGLYLKIGQAIAMQSAVLPPEFQARFARMFDDAPQNTWADVEAVIRDEFGGKSPEDVFQTIEKEARASASVAQVHWARLHDGREVAVKVQKKEIQQQVNWDLWAFKVVMYVYTKLFDLPLYGMVPFISERLLLETDFENEAQNAMRMATLVESESQLRGKVYIPYVYNELTTKRVMTAEWIEGVRLWDKATITSPWRGEKGHGTPGCRGEPMDATVVDHSANVGKPIREAWKGLTTDGGLGLQLKDVMQTMVDLFSAQMFMWGWVHCDPHPGNILIRRIPTSSTTEGRAELVLLDHGLYVHLPHDLRVQYAELWRALIALDLGTIKRVASGWGIAEEDSDLFGSAVLLRPYGSTRAQLSSALGSFSPSSSSSGESLPPMDEGERIYKMQEASRQAIRRIFGGIEGKNGAKGKWPLELIFVGRALRIIQANNQYLGSPANRIKLTGMWASRAVTRAEAGLETLAQREAGGQPAEQRIQSQSVRGVLHAFMREIVFRFVLLSSDLFFWMTRVRQWAGLGGGMEDILEAQMQSVASGLGVQLNSSVFEG